MSDPTPLLVPMAVQALLSNSHVQSASNRPFERWTPDYEALNSFDQVMPAPFAEDTMVPPATGIHLYWKLPAAFTHGLAPTPGDKVAFPFIPNRWAIGRLATATPGATPQLTVWVVQSDYLGADGTNSVADPRNSQPGNVTLTNMGRSQRIEEWQGEPGGPLFLRATGLSDVTFTAYQPSLTDILSFYDNVSGIAENSELTYWVCGWYSDPGHDLLASATPTALNWSVLGNPAAAPSLSVVHGMVHGVTWQTSSAPPVIDPDASAMKVAVGYTAVDALAAMLGDPTGEIETKLQAFQYGALETLDDADGVAQLELKIRRAWFGATPGGTRWKIVPVSQAQATQDPLDGTAIPAPFALDPAQDAWLAALNVTQRNYDRALRQLKTMQWELFALWWKSQRLPAALATQAGEQQGWGLDLTVIQTMVQQALEATAPGSALAAVTAQQTLVAGLASQLPDPTSSDSIAAFSANIPDNASANPLTLRPAAQPAFHHPSDPVVLVAGMTPPASEPDSNAALPCRTLDALVTGVTIPGAGPVTRASGSLAGIIALPATQALPAGVSAAVQAIAVEAFFVDPLNAQIIVTDGPASPDPAAAAALAAAMAAGTAQTSTIPDPLQAGFAFAPWTQAWSPLFLQWEIQWFPTVANTPSGAMVPPQPAVFGGESQQQDNWAFLQSGWAFDGSDNVIARGGEFYNWTGGELWDPSLAAPVPAQTYNGRSFLTPQAMDTFLKRIATYVSLHPDDTEMQALETAIEAISNSRFLSQSLSGFNDAFLMRSGELTSPPPPGPLAAAIGAENRGIPMVSLGDQDLDFGSGTPFFFPVRGGFFQFNRLVIVDAYGQVLDLLYANGNGTGQAADFQPIRGAGLSPDAGSTIDNPATRVRQVPRIVQPSRLNIRLFDAADDSKEVYYAPDADPVCGWLLPNHLDQSIAVYDAGGTALGELIVLADQSGQRVDWLPAPGPNPAVTDPSQIANPHLGAALSAFTQGSAIAPTARVAAFQALYQSIDETLWTVDPPGGQSDHDLAVLIGRPLALIRVELQFELYGNAATNQSWRDTLQAQDAGLAGFSFPIRLGSPELLDDGVIGYFTSDNYGRFNAVHASSAAISPYVVPVVPGNYLSLPFVDSGQAPTVMLTMLLDPRGKIHANTGMQPVTSFELPSEFYTDALKRMGVTFRVGPILTQWDTIRMPVPAEQNGSWAWMRHTGAGTDPTDWETDAIVTADAKARLPGKPPRLIDGWLQFTPKSGL
ncbi:hypothetical protein OF829_16665 [Sphingomonas sp. LB-2]|uniref:hypothetical protein n=1 Tax=Sphingomonas caeni TaxID=2984949 RepID=UPI00222F9BB0|nr:hypothetical protein [Sphingomonas caeni]MCW3848871.1 hypothetical protein [Sphingomonas caeni]